VSKWDDWNFDGDYDDGSAGPHYIVHTLGDAVKVMFMPAIIILMICVIVSMLPWVFDTKQLYDQTQIDIALTTIAEADTALPADLITRNLYPYKDSTYSIGRDGNEYLSGYFDHIYSPTGRTATYVIASTNSPAHVKSQADYVTSNITATIASLIGTGNNHFHISVGDYAVCPSIVIDEPNILITGDGNATRLYATSGMTGDYIIDITDGGDNFWIDGVSIDGSDTADYCIRSTNTVKVQDVRITSCTFSDCGTNSALIGLSSIDGGLISNCFFYGNESLGINILDSSEDIVVWGNEATGLDDTFCSAGTDTVNTIKRVLCAYNTINGIDGRGFDFYGSIEDSGAYYNHITNKNDGVVVQKSTPTGYYPKNIEVIGNHIKNPEDCGLKFYQCGNTTVKAALNTIVVSTAGANAIECDGTGANALYALLLESNTVNMERQNTYSCIYVGDGSVTGTLKIDNNYTYGGAIGALIRTIKCGGTFNGNTLIQADYNGAAFEGCSNFAVNGNTAVNNNNGGHANTTQGAAFAFYNRSGIGCGNNTVTSNIAYDDRPTQKQTWGFVEAGNSDWNIFSTNIGRNNAHGNITTVGANTIKDNNL